MKYKFLSFATIVGAMAMFCSCSDYDFSENAESSADSYFGNGENFDFATTRSVMFDVNYGSGMGAKSLVEVYEQIPEDGSDAKPLYTVMTDQQGRIKTNVSIPTYIKSVYLVNHRMGMPEYVECNIEDGKVAWQNPSVDKMAMTTRADAEIDKKNYADCVKTIDAAKKLYTIVSWDDQFGNVQGHPLVSTDRDLAGDDYANYVQNLQYTMWGGATNKPTTSHNNVYALSADKINTKILDTYTNASGNQISVESISLSLVFMDEGAWNQNAIGYYYYKTAEGAPAKANDIKKFICLPNASKDNHYPYGGHKDAYHKQGQAPAYAGESIDLLFENADGTFTKNFPPGYTVGYFVISRGFCTKDGAVPSQAADLKVGKIDPNQTAFYSDEKWNNNNNKRFMALSLPNGAIVYGLEDDTDNSFEDCLFIVKSSLKEAIRNVEIPTVDTEEKIIHYWDSQDKTYAFEDIWPGGGDYDLNDVVVEHNRQIEFESGRIRTAEDAFRLTAKDAHQYNGFAIQLSKKYLNDVAIKRDGIDITSRIRHYTDTNNNAETYVLFENVQEIEIGTKFTFTRTFTGDIHQEDFEGAERTVNPFVISKFTEADYTNGKMTEIHIPNYGKRTNKSTDKNSTGSDFFYVKRKGSKTYPFAIALPVKNFKPSPESVSIDKTYSNFGSWVKSNGKEHADWYLKK